MSTATLIIFGFGFLSGILFSLLFRLRMMESDGMTNKRAYGLIQRALHQFDPITVDKEKRA